MVGEGRGSIDFDLYNGFSLLCREAEEVAGNNMSTPTITRSRKINACERRLVVCTPSTSHGVMAQISVVKCRHYEKL